MGWMGVQWHWVGSQPWGSLEGWGSHSTGGVPKAPGGGPSPGVHWRDGGPIGQVGFPGALGGGFQPPWGSLEGWRSLPSLSRSRLLRLLLLLRFPGAQPGFQGPPSHGESPATSLRGKRCHQGAPSPPSQGCARVPHPRAADLR